MDPVTIAALTSAGIGVASAFSESGQPTMKPRKLSAAGRALKKQTYAAIRDLAPPNALTSQILGQAKRAGQARQRAAMSAFGGLQTQPVQTGVGLRGLLGEIGQRYQEGTAGPMAVGDLRTDYARRRLGYMSKFMGLERQVPIQLAQYQLTKQMAGQARGARQGAALGNVAEMMAILGTQKK